MYHHGLHFLIVLAADRLLITHADVMSLGVLKLLAKYDVGDISPGLLPTNSTVFALSTLLFSGTLPKIR
jgi:hypothetical protein